MNFAMMANIILVVANVLMLTALLVAYGGMLREVRSRLTTGLLLFGLVLWVQNAVQLYFFATMMEYYETGVRGLVLVQNSLTALALVFLVAVTWFPAERARAAAAP